LLKALYAQTRPCPLTEQGLPDPQVSLQRTYIQRLLTDKRLGNKDSMNNSPKECPQVNQVVPVSRKKPSQRCFGEDPCLHSLVYCFQRILQARGQGIFCYLTSLHDAPGAVEIHAFDGFGENCTA
jgi:hypothetical protein